jgi:NAD(P)-dependent dehydrogenase (short-subunit alcohol dehydrogenase family)
MSELQGKTAVITGGASGIGLAMCEAFAREGMRIAMLDVEVSALEHAAELLREGGLDVTPFLCDVTSQESVNDVADQVFGKFGSVYLLCNNAGVGVTETGHRLWQQSAGDWSWVYSINVLGVVHGLQAYVPKMIAAGQGGHVVNTTSPNGGLFSLPTTPIYASSKAAVTSLTEVLYAQLQLDNTGIQAHLLYPGPHIVNTNILNAQRNRRDESGNKMLNTREYTSIADLAEKAGLAGQALAVTEPWEVAASCVSGVVEGKFWILPTTPELEAQIEARHQSLIQKNNPVLQGT